MAQFGYACAVLLAAVFVRAGAAKLARPAATAATFAALGLPGAAGMARAVPVVELLVAAALLAAPRAGAGGALVLLAAFSAVLARAVRAGADTPCNCFGSARADPVSAIDLVRNVLLAGLAIAALVVTRPTVSAFGVAVALVVFAVGASVLATLRRYAPPPR